MDNKKAPVPREPRNDREAAFEIERVVKLQREQQAQLQRAFAKHEQRRFSGRLPTLFGSL